jgi:regulator of RNase E activity RraA
MTHAVASWLELGSPNVSDALRSCGKSFQAMDGGIRPLAPAMKLAGPAFTVRCFPGATWALEKALDLAKPGDVLVVDGGGYPDVILMGGLMSTRAQARGIGGAVLDAAVRDVDDIIGIGFAVFSRHVCPRAGTFAEIGEWQTTICCGRIPVNPGDFVVADASGIVSVPADMTDDVFARASQVHRREADIAKSLERGLSFAESAAMYDDNGHH